MTEEKTIYGYTTYYNAVHYLQPNLILCNNIADIDNTVYDNMRFNLFDDEDNQVEIYQWFLTSLNEGDVEWLEEKFNLLFTYSEKLDVYVYVSIIMAHCGRVLHKK